MEFFSSLLVMCISLSISLWQYFEKNRAFHQAEAEAEKARKEAAKSYQVAELLKDMLKGVGPSVALGRDTAMLREILDKTAERLGKDLKDQPDVESALRSTIGNTYLELGEYSKAEAMHRRALSLRENIFGSVHTNVAQSLDELATSLWRQWKLDEAEGIWGRALEIRQKLLGREHALVADSLNSVGLVFDETGKATEAEALHRHALEMAKRLLGEEHPLVATALNNLAGALELQGRHSEAEAIYWQALALRRNLLGSEHPESAVLLRNLANTTLNQRKWADAESLARKALAIQRKVLGNEHPDVAISLNTLAVAVHMQKRVPEAEALCREALAMQRKVLGNEHPDVGGSLNLLANALKDEGRVAEAESLYREALAILIKCLSGEDPSLAGTLDNLANLLLRQNKYAEAEQLYREYLHDALRNRSPTNTSVLNVDASLAQLLADWAWAERSKIVSPAVAASVASRAREAERLLRKCLTIHEFSTGVTRDVLGVTKSRLGAALTVVAFTDTALTTDMRELKLAEAESLLWQEQERMGRDSKCEAKDKRDGIQRLIRLYEAWDKPEKLSAWKRALTMFDQTAGQGKSGDVPGEN